MPWTVSDVDRFNEGLTDAQKRQWVQVANSALASCLADGGNQSDCEASAIRQANGVVANSVYHTTEIKTHAGYEIRYATHQGRKHLIVPVIMMREGVHCGSHGCLFHSADELGRFVAAWNGIPVTINHPEGTANDPSVIDSELVGRVYNAHMQEDKLKGEFWLDEERLREISPMALTYIVQQRPLDVSLGMFTDDELTEGTWNDEQYIGIARNHKPDHCAILPGAQGACSWAAGCGIRANSEGGDCVKEHPINANQVNEDYVVLMQQIQRQLDAMDNDYKIHFLEMMSEGEIVYRIDNRESQENRYYKRGYSVNEDGTVDFADDITEVVKRTSYVEKQNNNKEVKAMSEKKGKCCPEKVELLIQSDFINMDKEVLENMDEAVVDSLIAMDEGYQTLKSANDELQANEDPPAMNEDQAVKVLEAKFADPEQFMGLLPKDVAAQVKHGMKLHEEHRASIIGKIQTCTDAYTEDELKEMDTDALTKLSKAVKVPVDYSAKGAGGSQTKEEPLVPPMV